MGETLDRVVQRPGPRRVVAALVWAGIEVRAAAAVLASIVVGLIAGTFFFYSLRRLGSLIGAAVVGGLAALLTVPFALSPQSEALFGLIAGVAVMSAGSFVRSRDRSFLLVASLMAVASVAIRTVGLAVMAGIAVTAWLVLEDDRRKWGYSAGIGLLTFETLAGTGERVVAWHPPNLQTLKEGVHAIVRWFVPPFANPIVESALFAVLVVGLTALLWSAARGVDIKFSKASPWWPATIVALFQVLMLLAARTFFVAQTNLTDRLLYPVALTLLIGVVEFVTSDRGMTRTGPGKTALIVICATTLIASSWVAMSDAQSVRSGDRGIASSEFTAGAPIDTARQISGDHVLYSNYPDALLDCWRRRGSVHTTYIRPSESLSK